MAAFQASINETGSVGDSLLRVANLLTDSAGVLIRNLLSVNDLKDEGRARLREEALKTKSLDWEPPKNKLRKQIKEALDEDGPADALYRKIYLVERSIKPVIIFALICNGKNYGNRMPKAKPKETLEGRAEEGFKDGDGKLLGNPLEEDVKSWPASIFEALVKGLATVEMPDKIRAYCEYKDSIYNKRRESDCGGEGNSDCEDEQIVLLKTLIRELMKIAFPGKENDGSDAQNPLKRQRVELAQRGELEYATTQALNSGQIPNGLEDNPQPQSTPQVEPKPRAKPTILQEPNSQLQSMSQVQLNAQTKRTIAPNPNPQAEKGTMLEILLTVAQLCHFLPQFTQHGPCYVNEVGTGPEPPVRLDTAGMVIMLFRNVVNWSSSVPIVRTTIFKDLEECLGPETNLKTHIIHGSPIATTILLDRAGLILGWLGCSNSTMWDVRQSIESGF